MYRFLFVLVATFLVVNAFSQYEYYNTPEEKFAELESKLKSADFADTVAEEQEFLKILKATQNTADSKNVWYKIDAEFLDKFTTGKNHVIYCVEAVKNGGDFKIDEVENGRCVQE